MAIHIELLACKHISEAARSELKRAACPIHKDVPGLEADIEIVELHHGGWESGDRSGMSVWDTIREIQIVSLGLYLVYKWNDAANGMVLMKYEEDGDIEAVTREILNLDPEEDELELPEHPF